MSDAAVTTICATALQIVIAVVGFLALWVRQKYGAEKAAEAADKAKEAAAKVETVGKKVDDNTEITARVEQQTNGPLNVKLGQVEDHGRRIAALEAKLEGLSKNLDSTRHEIRGHLQTVTTKLDLMLLKPTAPPAPDPKAG